MTKIIKMLSITLLALFFVSACSNSQEMEEDMSPEEAPASIDMNTDEPTDENEMEDPAGETEMDDPASSESESESTDDPASDTQEDSTMSEDSLEEPEMEIEDSNN